MSYGHFKGSTNPQSFLNKLAQSLGSSGKYTNSARRCNFGPAGLFDWLLYCDTVEPPVSVTSQEIADYQYVRQIAALFKKNKDFSLPGIDPRSNAAAKWAEAEYACRKTNLFFDEVAEGNIELMPDVARVISKARWWIGTMLGECPTVSELSLRYGPGTVAESSGYDVRHAFMKLGYARLIAKGSCAEMVADAAKIFAYRDPEQASLLEAPPKAEPWRYGLAKLAFVPKNYKTDRPIIKEPGVNQLYQMGIGSLIRNVLKRFGNDLNTNSRRNSNLAFYGSVWGTVATVDFESASDMIAKRIVELLLPREWYRLLSGVRSGYVDINYDEQNGEQPVEYELEKFSSMGSGFTFELESLIFYALALAASEESGIIINQKTLEFISVHGDDVCISSQAVDLFIRISESLGFKVNKEKSFTEGPFRESCGKDYLRGRNVRPFYLKNVSMHSLYCFHNFFVRAGNNGLADLIAEFIVNRRATAVNYSIKKILRDGKLTAKQKETRIQQAQNTGQVYWGPMSESDHWLITNDRSLWSRDRRKEAIHRELYGYSIGFSPAIIKGYTKNSTSVSVVEELNNAPTSALAFSAERVHLLSTMGNTGNTCWEETLFPLEHTDPMILHNPISGKMRDYKIQTSLCFT